MRAAQFHAARDIRINHNATPPPSPPPPGYVTIEIYYCGICGSDLHEYLIGPVVIPSNPEKPHPITGEILPITLGHEFCGRVLEIGPGVNDDDASGDNNTKHGGDRGRLEIGTPVMVDPRLNCNSCSFCTGSSSASSSHTLANSNGDAHEKTGSSSCQQRRSHLCPNWGFLGLSGTSGGLSDLALVRADMLYPLIPPTTTTSTSTSTSTASADEILRLAPLIEPLAVAHHAISRIVSRLPVNKPSLSDSSILVLGGGPIGLAVILDLSARGAVGRLLVSEPTATRREQVGRCEGVHVVLDPTRENVAERCRAETHDGQGVDIVIDCAGVERGMLDGMAAVRAQGCYMNVAGWEGAFTIPMQHFMLREIDLLASFAYDDQAFAETVENFLAGKYPHPSLVSLVTSRIHLDDVAEKGFEELVNHRDRHVKILVTPRRDLL